MLVISDSSPLIVLSRINHLEILKSIFGEVVIPDAVYEETVMESNNKNQRKNINKANILLLLQILFLSFLVKPFSCFSCCTEESAREAL